MIQVDVCKLLLILTLTAKLSVSKKCTLLSECPALLNMFKDKPNDQQTIQTLQSSHCGFEGHMPKVLCDDLDYKCKTPDSINGVCTPIRECEHVIKLLQNMNLNDTNARNYIRSYKCDGYQNRMNINVCCPEKYQGLRELLPKPGQCGINKPIPMCPECCCVVAGNDAEIAEFPWMALLYYKKIDNAIIKPGCGGSLINNRYVLTAAHCVDKSIWNSMRIEQLEHVVLGEHDTRTETDCIENRCTDPIQIVHIESYFIHPQWNKHSTQNDIALMRLKNTVHFTDFIRPICLPTSDIKLKTNENVVLSGWGKISSLGPSSPVLMKAWLPVLGRENCSFLRKKLSNKQLCIGEYFGRDSCNGDSGGPVMKIEFNGKNTGDSVIYYIVGIVSYGTQCGTGPAVYTDVSRYIDWIYQNVN